MNMSSKPDGSNGKKQSKPSVYKAKSSKPAQRQARLEVDHQHKKHLMVPHGATRAKRRAYGDFNPVNPEASLAQHPNSAYAMRLRTPVKKAA
jgi:hypothetical protein